MTSFKLRVHRGQVHTNIYIYAGPDEQHRVHAGRLTFLNDEAQDFLMRFTHDTIDDKDEH